MASDERQKMVQDDAIRQFSRRRTSAQSPPRRDEKESRKGKSSTTADSPPKDKPSDLEALRKARLEYIDTPAEERRKKMKYVGETITRQPAKKADVQHVRKASGSKRRRKGADPERRHRKRKVRATEAEAGEYQSVYQKRNHEEDVASRRVGVKEKESDNGSRSDVDVEAPAESIPRTMERRSETGNFRRPSRQDVNVEKQRQPSRRRQSEPTERIQHARRNSYGIDECPSALIHK